MSKNNPITKEPVREIIEDFAREIQEKKVVGPKPSKAVIFFRNEAINNVERDVVEVPINLLRFRKENGRIASDVLSYEKDHGQLIESDLETQDKLKKFLYDKDTEKTNELMQSIRQFGQLQPVIITADGFLINGNRRKVALERLYEIDNDPKWKRMKVVILPGEHDEGGPPTLKEIEQIENRYQLQSEGKAEYSLFDRALSIRRKRNLGIPIEEQLRDDPMYSYMEEREFKRAVNKFEKDFLEPLDHIDRYLNFLDRPGIYSTISTGPGDREGRWQAFVDYSNVINNLSDPKYRQRRDIKINDDELGDVEEIAFKLIRKRQFPQMPKIHQIIRNLPKYLSHQESKDALFELNKIDFLLSEEESVDKDGVEYDEREKDKIWGAKYGTTLIRQVKKANDLYDKRKDKETPLKLLDDALKKLKHDDMRPDVVSKNDLSRARFLAEQIEKAAHELKQEFYELSKNKK